MKKYLFTFALFVIGLSFTACDENEKNKNIPEGTAEVNIEEDDTEVTSENLTNWTQYSVQVANLLTSDATSLMKAWKEDYKNEGPYAETFKNPGNGKTYTSYSACVEEIITGCADIANEVGTAKIGEPRDLWEAGNYTEAVYAVESWYSFHSITDYSNNILSIRNAINGSRSQKSAEHSIANYLKENNEELYNSITSKVTAAYSAIQSMDAPFRSHIGSNGVVAAMNACASLESELTNRLLPYMTNIPEEDLKPIIENYIDAVVLPTYEDLVESNTKLNTAIRALANEPNNNNFEAAAKAWMAAREPWETSEAFLFGPVADSWPLDVAQLKETLTKGSFENLEWNGEFDEEDETIATAQGVRGFHTLEFLLFKNGEPRTIKK